MIDLSTQYLGLTLRSPLVCSSSPLCESLDNLRRMEDAGAGAIVLQSLFEEQLTVESLDLDRFLLEGTEANAESLSYFPDMSYYNLGPEAYLQYIRDAKHAVGLPIIGSLNGVTPGGWLQYARDIEKAGADGLELNVYYIPTDPQMSGPEVEERYIQLVRLVTENLRIPVAVKLSPYFSAPAALARRLVEAGAAGLVLFNRFYQPEFNLDTLEVEPSLQLSRPGELLLRLHWVAILFGQVHADLAVTGGVHSASDVLKCMMAGGRVAMLTAALLKNGIDYLRTLTEDLVAWMEAHEYESIRQMQGSMSLQHVRDRSGFERGNYMKVLRSYALKTVGFGA